MKKLLKLALAVTLLSPTGAMASSIHASPWGPSHGPTGDYWSFKCAAGNVLNGMGMGHFQDWCS